MNYKSFFYFLLIVLAASSCYYDKEELLYGANVCDTTNVRYSVHIATIINSNCISCHGGTAANGGGIKLGTYADVKVVADNGSLLNAVSRSASPMPKGGPRLSNCRIAEISTWIRTGAPNN
jgi:mono/diheme cytochrome c family protein